MSWRKTIQERGLLWVSVHAGLWIFDRVFEYGFYPKAITAFGLVEGTGVMMLASFLVCWILIELYDRLPVPWVRDALGFETLKEAAAESEEELLNPEFPKVWSGVQSPEVSLQDVGALLRQIVSYRMYVADVQHALTIGLMLVGVAVVGALVPLLPALTWVLNVLLAILFPLRVVFHYLHRGMAFVWVQYPRARSTILFLYLSLWWDPMTTLIIMRPKDSHVMGPREWSVFLGSVALSNTSWGLMVWAGVETVSELFPVLLQTIASFVVTVVGR